MLRHKISIIFERRKRMKTEKMLTILLLALGLLVWQAEVSNAAPMGTAWTYQGRLMDANEPADGLYDFQFKLFDVNVAGTQQGSRIDIDNLDVIDGYFTVELDFGNKVFKGNARWLEVAVRPWDSIERHTTLFPRHQMTPAPYALYAETTSNDNDWTVSGDDMYSAPSGNVGIGTTTPTAKLEVAGDMKMAIEDDITLSLVSGIGNSSKIALGQRFNNESAVIELDNTTGIFRFGRPFESNSITIDGNGNVGVGTASPDARLNVEQSTGAWGEGIRLSYGVHDWDFVTDNGGARLHIAQNEDSEKGLTIFDGRVGVGMTNPVAQLEVSKDYWENIVRVGTPDTSNRLTLSSGPDYASVSGGVTNQDHIMISHSTGNVSIGNSGNLPQAKLEVNGDLSVNSNLRVKGNVTVDGSHVGSFPRPAYDSDWQSVPKGSTTTLTHNIGGDASDYVVDLTFKNAGGGIHKRGIGGDNHHFAGEWVRAGAYWEELTPSSIQVIRRHDADVVEQVRVRIWVYD
jgi:hypothetical protein